MTAATLDLPSAETAQQAQLALRTLSEPLPSRQEPAAHLSVERNGEPVEAAVPIEAYKLFLEILGQLANGNAVTIVPVHAELTTQEAADLLNVSRPYFVGLLEGGAIPFRLVGTHRRIRAEEVFRYKREDDKRRGDAARELTQLSEDLGLGY